jgi:hypothetical protein
MTTSTPTGRPPVDLTDPAQLLAALPYLLGFRPGASVVLLGHLAPAGRRIGLLMRADLPRGDERVRQAQALAPRFTVAAHIGVTLAIIGGERRPGAPPPHAGFIDELADAFAECGIPVMHAVWAADIATGAAWACYRDEDCAGVLPDPRSTVTAAAATESGTVVFGSREEVLALLAPRSPEAVARRSEELSRLSGPPWPEATRVADAAAEVREAFDRQRRGEGPPTDAEAVRLACALTFSEIRDVCLTMAVPPRAPAAREAERLWLTLVRELPAPERAEAAALLGYTAFMRGDGTLAGMALDNALEAAPDHLLANLLSQVLDHGTPPEVLLGLAMAVDPDGVTGFGLEPAEPPS